MGLLEILSAQHQSIEQQLELVARADEPFRRELFIPVAHALVIHIKSEEQIFYAALDGELTAGLIEEGLEEHEHLLRLVEELVTMRDFGARFVRKVRALAEVIESHQQEEEDLLFPRVRLLISADERQRMGRELLALQAELGRRAPPDQPDGGAVSVI